MKMNKTENIFINLEDYINVGHENAVSREYLCKVTGMTDRILRKTIEESDLPIINMGYGYYIPDMENEVDAFEARKYVTQELARINTIEDKLQRKFPDMLMENEPELEDFVR